MKRHTPWVVKGSIPACAGEPDIVRHSSLPSPVYPRVCGGTGNTTATGETTAGLSPRVRGNPFFYDFGAGFLLHWRIF